jgi:negative regulator of flagellin synthesis FlgM
MSNEISGIGGPRVNTMGDHGRVAPTQSETGQLKEQTGNPAAGDTVKLTETGKQLSKLESKINEVPVVDSQRVENLRQAIANGSYEVHAGKVSQKLMQFEAYLPA